MAPALGAGINLCAKFKEFVIEYSPKYKKTKNNY